MSRQPVLNIASKSELQAVPLPVETDSYSPVPHGLVIQLVQEALEKYNMPIVSDSYKMTCKGQQAMGFHTLASGGDKEMKIQLLWSNSYNKTMPLRASLGTMVLVCTNGMMRFVPMAEFKRRHTGSVIQDFTDSIGQYIDQAGDYFQKLVRDRERMKEIELTKRTCAELIGRMYIEEALLTETQVAIVKKELEHPSFIYNADGTAWELYNHATVALREAHPLLHVKQHNALHEFFTEEFHLQS